MRQIIKITICAIAISAALIGSAQTSNNSKFAIKAYGNIGLGDAMKMNSNQPGVNSSSSTNAFGLDFGWSFWQKQNHSLEANVGLAYSVSSIKIKLENLDYAYSAPTEADMDGESYIRHYELKYLNQKNSLDRLSVPVYLSYGYRCNDWLKLHADWGVGLGFKVSSKLSDMSGEGYCYGIYPQYDNLKIDESYLNDFGANTYSKTIDVAPTTNSFSCSILAGAGVEFKISGPISADLSLRYDSGLTDQYKSVFNGDKAFDLHNAPITYTVAGGQHVKSLTNYVKSSKLSHISLKITLIYHF